MRHAARSGLGELGWARVERRASFGPGNQRQASLPTAHVALCAGPNMQGPNLYGIMGQTAGKVRLANATHPSVPHTEHRPCAIAATRAEVHEGHEDVRAPLGQRDHVQLANKSQGHDQGYRAMSRRRHKRRPRPLAASLPARPRARTEPPARPAGTNMAFVGFKKPTDSADVIAYLNQNK